MCCLYGGKRGLCVLTASRSVSDMFTIDGLYGPYDVDLNESYDILLL